MGFAGLIIFSVLIPIFHVIGIVAVRTIGPLVDHHVVPHVIECLHLEESPELLPFALVAVAYSLTYLSFMPSIAYTILTARRVDNNHPRAQKATQTGLGHRLTAAHQNMHEAFPGFAVAVILAYLLRKDDAKVWAIVTTLSVTFILARLAFQLFYFIGIGGLRSMSWLISFYATVFIFAFAVWPKCTGDLLGDLDVHVANVVDQVTDQVSELTQ